MKYERSVITKTETGGQNFDSDLFASKPSEPPTLCLISLTASTIAQILCTIGSAMSPQPFA